MGLRRDLRLRRRADFDSVYKRGRIFNDPLLVLRTLPNELPHNRYGFVVSKRVGGAVVRNRVRRRLQEIVMGFDKPTNLQTDKPGGVGQDRSAAADSPRDESQGWGPSPREDSGQDGGPDPQVVQGYDIVLSAKAATVGATFQELTASVRRLYAKGGLLTNEAGS